MSMTSVQHDYALGLTQGTRGESRVCIPLCVYYDLMGSSDTDSRFLDLSLECAKYFAAPQRTEEFFFFLNV